MVREFAVNSARVPQDRWGARRKRRHGQCIDVPDLGAAEPDGAVRSGQRDAAEVAAKL